MRSPMLGVVRGAALATALSLCCVGAAKAQWEPHFAVGYVVNAPNQFVGFSGRVLTAHRGGLGLYLDAKFEPSSPRDREGFEAALDARSAEAAGDIFYRDDSDWRSFNAAVVKAVSPELLVYLGGGYSRGLHYSEYVEQDEERDLGQFGYYWVEDPERNRAGINLIGGGFFSISDRVSLQFGLETAPRGATVGASYAFPLGR